MGLFSNKYANAQISSPKGRIVATEDRFVFQHPITLMLKEKVFSLSGDDFDIKDISGVPYFKCKGKTFSIRDKKKLYDINGKALFNVKNKLLSLTKKIKIYEGEDDTKTLAVIRPNSVFVVKNCVVEFLNKATGKNETLAMKCDFFGNSCAIYCGSDLICKISRRIDLKLAFTTKDTYYIEIAPNVDIAFMLAIGICFDEIKNENKDR